MRGKARSADKEQARKLRIEQRLSAAEISRILNVPKPNLSGWLKDIPLTSEEQRKQQQRSAASRVYPPTYPNPTKAKRILCSSAVGVQAVAFILNAFVSKGWQVSLPFGDHMAYDMVLDKGDGILLRIQCKEGCWRNGAIVYRTESTTVRAGGVHHRSDYRSKCDMFAVHHNGTVYMVPPAVASTGAHHLRVMPARNGQTTGVTWARDFELK